MDLVLNFRFLEQINMDNTKCMVSVLMVTYNHEKYISEAIEGVLMQKTNFQIELIVADDASTDNNQIKIKSYAEKHKIIRPILRQQNIGANQNWIDAVKICNGKYIALCEGDDYWIDPYKLQKQVDFLESDFTLAGCVHGCTIQYELQNRKKEFIYQKIDRIDFSSFLKNNYFTATASIMFRPSVLKNYPNFHNEIFAGDFVLKYAILSVGDIGYIPENMCVYRKGSIGSWSNRKISYKIVNKEFLDNLRILYYFDEITNSKYYKAVHWKTKKLVASYLFQTAVFNSLWVNIGNFAYSFPFLPLRVNGAFLKRILDLILKQDKHFKT